LNNYREKVPLSLDSQVFLAKGKRRGNFPDADIGKMQWEKQGKGAPE